jgi:hypothetical protein
MSKSRDQLNALLGEIDISGKSVLDIGVQDKPSSRKTRGQPKLYATVDVDGQWNPDYVLDLNEDWEALAITQEMRGGFDAVFCIETLEHCWHPVQAVENIAFVAAPAGDIYVSTPFINPHHDYWDYLRFTGEWFQKVFDKFGIEIVALHERVATVGKPQLQEFFTVEGLRISKIRPEYGRYSYPIGYFVHGRKL